MEPRLFAIPASHPAIAAALMLEHKRISYRRVDLMPVISKGVLRAAGFPGVTVPALRIGGERIQGSREISRALDRLSPELPLFPADPERRRAVEAAERFGDEELQAPVRQILWWTIKKDKRSLGSYSEGASLGVPVGLAMKASAPIVALSARFNEADEAHCRRALAELPAMLDRIDAWIADGTLGGEVPNAADFQIATSLGLAMTLDDLRPAIAARPAGRLVQRIVPDYPGRTPAIIPPSWLAGLAAA